jgi:hypothetical protein
VEAYFTLPTPTPTPAARKKQISCSSYWKIRSPVTFLYGERLLLRIISFPFKIENISKLKSHKVVKLHENSFVILYCFPLCYRVLHLKDVASYTRTASTTIVG